MEPFLRAVSAINPKPKIVLISAYPTEIRKYSSQVDGCLDKPIGPDELRACLAMHLPVPQPIK